MGQLEDLYVPRSMVTEETKRRQDAEKRLAEVLRYLDPQPAGGPIYMAPFPEPGDLGERMVALAERWEREASTISEDDARVIVLRADLLMEVARQLRTVLGEHASKGTEKPEWQYGPREVVVYAEEGICIEPLLIKVGAARTQDEAHDLVGSGQVEIEERHVQESHWRGTDQEFTLFVGKAFTRRVRITSDPQAEWLMRVADVEEEVGGFPTETGVVVRSLKSKP